MAGDYNMSYNTEYHRHRTSSSQVQNTMLNSALDNAGLTDAWIQRHGHSTTYRTWEERKEGENQVWTSPDHILISQNQAGRVSAIQVDDATLDHGMDHSMVTAAIYITDNTKVKRVPHRKLKCPVKEADPQRSHSRVPSRVRSHR